MVGVKYHEVINMTKHEKQFEERLNSLILLKALLMKENAFDERSTTGISERLGRDV